MKHASLIATLMAPPSPTGAELRALPDAVEWLEVRSDLVGDISPEWLRSHFRGRLLHALRSQDEGGNSSDSLASRHQRLETAARLYDRVELEASRDLSQELLAQIPFEKRMVSWHGNATDLADLQARFKQLSSVPASVYKLVTTAAAEFTAETPALRAPTLGLVGWPGCLANEDEVPVKESHKDARAVLLCSQTRRVTGREKGGQ